MQGIDRRSTAGGEHADRRLVARPRSRARFGPPAGFFGGILLLASALAGADGDERELGPIEVTGARQTSTVETTEQAVARLEAIPGGTAAIEEDEIRRGRAGDLADALALSPGVFARSRFGQGETRLSIRGSGLSRPFNVRSLRFLRDGLSESEADGNTRSQLIDPLGVQRIEVLRGANAFGYGAATLGGIGDRDHVTDTGIIGDVDEEGDRVFNPGVPRSYEVGVQWEW